MTAGGPSPSDAEGATFVLLVRADSESVVRALVRRFETEYGSAGPTRVAPPGEPTRVELAEPRDPDKFVAIVRHVRRVEALYPEADARVDVARIAEGRFEIAEREPGPDRVRLAEGVWVGIADAEGSVRETRGLPDSARGSMLWLQTIPPERRPSMHPAPSALSPVPASAQARRDRPATRGEELWNSLTHGVGFALSAIGLCFLLAYSWGRESHVALSCAVYGVSLAALYAASAIYHGLTHERLKHIFRVADHCCIYLVIAGSYTPFTLMYMRTGLGWTLLCAVWGLALVGFVHKIFFIHRFPRLSLWMYLGMGWMAIFGIEPMLRLFPTEAMALIGLGGLLYTVGAIFYALDHKPYFHTVWHLFVLAASGCHFAAVLGWVALA